MLDKRVIRVAAGNSAFVHTGLLLYLVEFETVFGSMNNLVAKRLLEGLEFVLKLDAFVLEVGQ
jgi:hypothetical protein